jgi:alpha-L-fucosidase
MNRREFAYLLGALASTPAAFSFPVGNETGNKADPAGDSPSPAGFNKYTEDWAQFCATPENERVFYALVDGRIVSERLDNENWRPTDWGHYAPSHWYHESTHPPELPVPGGSHYGVPMISPIPNLAGQGSYEPTWESLLQYECPEWYRDAKFGIWNHWSPQCVPEDGDVYAHNMYVQGSGQNKFHLAHYGHPSLFGYKDISAQWTLLNWDPSELMDLYVRAGARIFLALANHHDNFDTWNSKYQPWNAMNVGPRRDVIATWAAEARKRNLRFGVTTHSAVNWWGCQVSHGADATGPLAGIPYDGRLTSAEDRNEWWHGLDPQRLYIPKHPENALPDISYVKNYYDRVCDLIDQHNPDLVYFDETLLPLGWGGMNIGAYYYNRSLAVNGGKMEAVINVKNVPPNLAKAVVYDIERGGTSGIQTYPFQTETCIGDWHYLRSLYEWPGEYGQYLPPRAIIHWMVDVVSKNGTFILNVPGKPDGTIDSKERRILEEIGEWFKINGEAIYETRPWTVFGEGPHMLQLGSYLNNPVAEFDASDIRYTRNKAGTVVYAIVLGWPQSQRGERESGLLLKSFGASAAKPVKVANVELLGCQQRMQFNQTSEGLHIEWPSFAFTERSPRDTVVIAPSDIAVAFRLSLV